LAVGEVGAGGSDGAGQQDVGRETVPLSFHFADDAAEVGVLKGIFKNTAGLDELEAGVVHGRAGMVQAADEGELVGMAGHAREDLADFNAGDIGFDGAVGATNVAGGIGLGVPGVELGGSADEGEEDATDFAGRGVDRRRAKTESTEGPEVQDVTAAKSIARFEHRSLQFIT